MNSIFEKLIRSKIEHFLFEYSNLSRSVFVNEEGKLIHPGEFGMYRERIVSDLLKPFLPTRLAIGTGFIITHNNNISTQCDLIIYDREHTPVIENSEQRFFPVECVVGVIEVKSKLTKADLAVALKKLADIKKLRKDIEPNNPYIFNDGNHRPIFHSYFDYASESFTNAVAVPSKKGYEYEHILLFVNYFYMLLSSVSIMYIEITKYLSKGRIYKFIH